MAFYDESSRVKRLAGDNTQQGRVFDDACKRAGNTNKGENSDETVVEDKETPEPDSKDKAKPVPQKGNAKSLQKQINDNVSVIHSPNGAYKTDSAYDPFSKDQPGFHIFKHSEHKSTPNEINRFKNSKIILN